MVRAFVPSAHDMRALLSLAVPIALVQIGLFTVAVVGTIMVGHVSATELAAAALGNLYVIGLGSFGIGTLWAVDPVVSQALGARDHEAVALGVQRGLVLGAMLGVAMALVCLPAGAVLTLLRQPAEVVPRAAEFVLWSAPSLLPLLLFVTVRQSLQAMKHLRAIVLSIVAANLVNVGLNWIFVFGHWGMPAMGATGSALAVAASRFAMFGAVMWLARHELGTVLKPWRAAATARGPLLATLRLGLPIGLQNTIEYVTFAAISIFAGWFGADAIAGHQVAINLASLMFMVPMGVGSAASVLVGRAIGEGDLGHARRLAASAVLCGAGFMALSACVLLAQAGSLARVWTSVPSVIGIAATLIPIAGVFQVFDGIQVVSAGVLRGAGDTRAPLIANMLGFWLMGMPVSLWLGFQAKLGVVGLWWGFVSGLAGVALFLVLRIGKLLSQPVERVRVGD